MKIKFLMIAAEDCQVSLLESYINTNVHKSSLNTDVHTCIQADKSGQSKDKKGSEERGTVSQYGILIK